MIHWGGNLRFVRGGSRLFCRRLARFGLGLSLICVWYGLISRGGWCLGLCAVLLAGYGLLSVTAYLLVQQFELVVAFKELSDRQQGLVAALGALQLNPEG